MTKLKTLIDLEKGMHVGDVHKLLNEERVLGSEYTTSIVLAGDLKQEAIKWIKADGEYLVKDTKTWIMLFFNIKKEDLK